MNEKVIACIPSKTMREFLTVNNFEMSALQAERASKEKLTRKQRNIYGITKNNFKHNAIKEGE